MSAVMAEGVEEHGRFVLVADHVVVLSHEIREDGTERTHGNTSHEMSQALDAWQGVG